MGTPSSHSKRIWTPSRHVKVCDLLTDVSECEPFLMLFRCSAEIIKLIQTGKMSQAIENTMRAYPGLLESNKNLLFALKCRQFIEMINGADIEVSTKIYSVFNNVFHTVSYLNSTPITK